MKQFVDLFPHKLNVEGICLISIVRKRGSYSNLIFRITKTSEQKQREWATRVIEFDVHVDAWPVMKHFRHLTVL